MRISTLTMDKIAFPSSEGAREAADQASREYPQYEMHLDWNEPGQCYIISAYKAPKTFVGYVVAEEG